MDPTTLDRIETPPAQAPTPDANSQESPAGGEPQAPPGQGDDAAPPSAPTAPPASLTPESIAAAIKQAGIGQAQQAAPQYTQDDFDKAFNVYKPSEAIVAKILAGGADAVSALSEIVAGVVRQASTMASYQVQLAKEELEGKLAPVMSFAQQQHEKELASEFFKSYPDLKGFEPIVKYVVDDMKANKANFPDRSTGMKTVAEKARAILKSLPRVNEPQGQGTPPPTSSSKMSSLTGGGQGGVGTPGTNGKTKGPPGIEVWD